MSFLPPMSGLADREFVKQSGEINFLIGQGRTAEVLRNLCIWLIKEEEEDGGETWRALRDQITQLFGVTLDVPEFIPERAEIAMTYQDLSGARLDLSSSGRGLQQTLLLLAYLASNPGSVLLLDEPDAHLEILRQRQIYQILTEWARKHGSQIVAASHSEVVLNEAADRDVVISFVGKPHRIDDRGAQLLKSLKEIGFEQYYQAEQTGWVLYLEGSTDLAILQAFARTLDHPARWFLERPFVHYVSNQPSKARNHFYGLRDAKGNLVGFALFDRLEQPLQDRPELMEHMWRRREIKNYLCTVETLLAYATGSLVGAQPGAGEQAKDAEARRMVMKECIKDFVPPAALRDRTDQWWVDTKVSDVFLDRVFQCFFRKLDLPNLMSKSDYHVLAEWVPIGEIDREVSEVLDAIMAVAQRAKPSAGDADP